MSSADGFKYLGLWLCKHRKWFLETNFAISPNFVNTILDSQAMRNTNIMGQILQIKQLVASTLIYQFSLVPTPSLNMLK